MLGHSSAAMTLDVYSGLFDDDLGALAERMDAAHDALKTPRTVGIVGTGDPIAKITARSAGLRQTTAGALAGQMRPVSWAHMATSTRFRAPSFRMRLAR